MRKSGNWIKSYLKYTSHSEAPDAFHFWTAVGTIAGALRRRVWIQELYYQWVPNFYIILVSPPAISVKSTTLDIAKSLLSEVPGINFGPESLTWQALVSALSDAREDVMIDGKYHPMSCLTFYSSELGSLVDLNDPKTMTVLTDLWDGKMGSWARATKTQGATVAVNPWINILAGTTPQWLAENLNRRSLGGGFISRCLFIVGNSKRRLVAYPSREVVDWDGLKRLRDDLLEDLTDISRMAGEFRLTDQAYEWGSRWYEDHWTNRASGLDVEGASGYAGRKQVHMHKLAMILSAAESSEGVIDARHLEQAEILLSALEQDIGFVANKVSSSTSAELSESIRAFIERCGKVLRSELWRRFMLQCQSYREFSEIIEGFVQAGLVQIVVESGKEWIRYRKP